MRIGPSTTVEDAVRRRPRALRVLLRHGLPCALCPLARFVTVGEACRRHGVSVAALLEALGSAAGERRAPRPEAGKARSFTDG
jgi:hybrid cluster-associated redox disulfide protein